MNAISFSYRTMETPPTDAPDKVSAKYVARARRQGMEKPVTGYDDERLKKPEGLLDEGWTLDGTSYEFQVDGRTIQRYQPEAPEGARLTTYDWRGRMFDAECLSRDADGAVTKWYQAG